jgi:hypothetical protein
MICAERDRASRASIISKGVRQISGNEKAGIMIRDSLRTAILTSDNDGVRVS